VGTEPTPPDQKQARMKEFMQLLPLTLELAGLPKCHPDRLFTPDQIEARVLSVRAAYKIARGLVKDVGENGV
jgi:hypothetical protein